MNCLTVLAKTAGRDYIIPSDVTNALSNNLPEVVRLDLLEVLGKATEFGWEDFSLCCYLAYIGNIEPA